MYKTSVAQKETTETVFNPTAPRRTTARGSERLLKGDDFMPDYKIEVMEVYVQGLREGKERSVGTACIKSKQNKTMRTISQEMLQPPGTIRGWLARGRDRGLHGLADKKSPGRPPMICGRVDETIREWLSKSPGDFGFERKRWQLNMLQKKLSNMGIKCSNSTARRAMRRVRFSFRKSRPVPYKSASMEEQKSSRRKSQSY